MLNEEQLVDRLYHVDRIVKPTGDIAILTLDGHLEVEPKPGQFVMFTIPSVGQKPISVSQSDPLELAVKNVGKFTREVYNLEPSADVLVRGPIGSGVFPTDDFLGDVYLIGGGMGIAPLRFLANKLYDTDRSVNIFLGAGTQDEILFRKELERAGEVHISTDNVSEGYHGTVVDLLRSQNLNPNSSAAICGPEKMMVAAAELLTQQGFNPDEIYLSLERRVKCGMGLCGSCEIGGYLVCQDGPVFSYSFIEEHLPSFGLYKRDSTGRRVPI